MVDWLIMEEGRDHPWLEVERHGAPRVLIDKKGVIQVRHIDANAIARVVEKKVLELRVKFPLFKHMPLKLVERELPVDAAYFYQALVLRPLVDLLRCVHCPDRHDYGFRYVKHDLPHEVYETIRRLSYFARPEQLIEHVKEASFLFDLTLKDWDSGANEKARMVT